MAVSKLCKELLRDIEATITELRNMSFLRDEKGISQRALSRDLFEISFAGKNDAGGIMYDKKTSCAKLMDVLLQEQQYTILLYDKSIIQAEFLIEGNRIVKERLVFLKKHNKTWDADEIDLYEAFDEDWFTEEYGIPIVIRIDYDPREHKDGEHPSSHLTLSNHESCRIPMKEAVTFSEFVRFILFHFYDKKLNKASFRLSVPEDITELEKKMIHVNWI